MDLDCHGITDRGQARETNEDQFLVAELERALYVQRTSLPLAGQVELRGPAFAQLLAVADGVGGSSGGERASHLAVRTVLRYALDTLPWCVRLDPRHDDDLVEELQFCLRRAQARLREEGQRDPARSRMATTLTMAFVVWPRVWVLHVGDSRCYHLHRGALHQVTVDHTVAQELASQGAISDSAARRSRWRDVLWNTVGAGEQEMDPRVHCVDLEPGDALLLCTDGVTKHVEDEELREVLASGDAARLACERLVALANQRGGSDNITCVVVRVPMGEPSGPVRLARPATSP